MDFRIDRKVDMLLSSDSAAGTAKSLGLGVIGFADAVADLAPDVMVVLGDRFEIFAAVSAALFAKIPISLHLHGGEMPKVPMTTLCVIRSPRCPIFTLLPRKNIGIA